MNLEDLRRKDTFLDFLRNRVQFGPSAFFYIDKESWKIGVHANVLKVAYVADAGMLFTKKESYRGYGEIILSTDGDRATWLIDTQRALSVHEGLMTLEVQARVYKFLADCCLAILPQNPGALGKSSAKLVEKVGTPIQASQSGATGELQAPLGTSVAERIALGPYSRPGSLELNQLVNMLQARKSFAEHEVWLLREDPGHFAAKLAEYALHRPEQLLGSEEQRLEKQSDLKANPRLKTPEFWNSVLQSLIPDAFFGVVFWNDLHDSIVKLRDLLEEQQAAIDTTKDLPKPLEIGFSELWLKLVDSICEASVNLFTLVPTCPKLRHKFRVHLGADTQQPLFREADQLAHPSNADCRELLQYLVGRILHPHLRHYQMTPILAEEMARYMENNPAKAKYLTSFCMEQISDILLLADCWNRISLFHPWATAFMSTAGKRVQEVGHPAQALTRLRTQLQADLMSEDWNPFSGHFYQEQLSIIWPGGQPSREYTVRRQTSEKLLDKFWEKVDSIVQPVVDQVPSSAKGSLRAPSPGTLARANWVAVAPEPAPATHVSERSWDTTEIATKPRPGPSARKPKKEKTRGTADPSRAVSEKQGAARQAAPAPEQVKFLVKKEDFEVFSALFRIPEEEPVKELSWRKLVQAMGRLGFSIEKNWGSMWVFTPPANLGGHAVTFHDPHPKNAQPLRLVRVMGKRLTRIFNWDGSMFELDE
ncbi:uncharacterized protein N7458_001144 [Penicillium daleae]|uniref:Uncharacterized protein n=1 Tax=Penicillium daleae TaxID=63821 RepID=A0AAD6G5X5_9EURO|nr:uncharacterized protein N7458_001144 [Penicillium daleae]KAJ5459592.1 hypothetical protein N7458_001144 [Penicillium daleae]